MKMNFKVGRVLKDGTQEYMGIMRLDSNGYLEDVPMKGVASLFGVREDQPGYQLIRDMRTLLIVIADM